MLRRIGRECDETMRALEPPAAILARCSSGTSTRDSFAAARRRGLSLESKSLDAPIAFYPRFEHAHLHPMPRVPPKSTIADIPRPTVPAPNGFKSPVPPVVLKCWIGLVARMDREHLDRFTRSTWRRFCHEDLEPLKRAILRRRRVLAR